MPIASRTLCCLAVLCLLATLALAAGPEPILANQNRTAAGTLANGVLNLHLEIRKGAWHPEAEDGPKLFVQAFGEEGKPLQIPGPMVRVPRGTNIHVSVANTLKMKATVYGLNTRPGDAKAGIELQPGEKREVSFDAGAPGTYFYWARTTDKDLDEPPYLLDAQLNGAFIVDDPSDNAPDRVFVIDSMLSMPDAIHEGIEAVSINGKSYPYTETLEYTQGERVRWRVINPSFSEHPMHLHGAFYQVLSTGDFEQETDFAEGTRQWVVTQNMPPARTMMLEWRPPHAGRWLYHCHFHAHMSNRERLPLLLENAEAQPHAGHAQHDMGTMSDMAGLVLAINVKPSADAVAAKSNVPPRKIDLVVEPTAAEGKLPTFSCSVREGKKIVASEDKAMGPPIVVTRGEPVEITVLNHLKEPTTIHWHGIELESYDDGVMGGGVGSQMSPAIAPGESFTAHFTPNRAGTFIYHTHAADGKQLPGGVYGALIVLEPGEQFDAVHDKILVFGSLEEGFFAKQLTVNGSTTPAPLKLTRDTTYRLRFINMAPEIAANLRLGNQEHPVQWRAVAKDGADLPERMKTNSEASLHFASGETYDFEFHPENAGEFPLEIENPLSHAKVEMKIVVQEPAVMAASGSR